MTDVSPQYKVIYNRMPEAKHHIESVGKIAVRQTLERIKTDVEGGGPYRGITEATVKLTATGGNLEVSPWWIGFIELGTVFRGARPFTEPAARKAFALFTSKMMLAERGL